MAEIIPLLGLIGVGYYIWQRFTPKPTAPDAIVSPSVNVAPAPIPVNPNMQPVAPVQAPQPEVIPVKPDERLMTFSELLGWSKDDPELFKRMFPLTLPKQVRERFEQTGVTDAE